MQLELFGMGLAIALAACFLPPDRLRKTGAAAALTSLALALAMLTAHGPAVVVLRGLAGVANGLLIWITVGFLARRSRPEPWAATFFMIQSLGQLSLAGLTSGLFLPRWGLAGGLAVPAVLATMALVLSLRLPPALPPLAQPAPMGLPSPRGLVGLIALLAYVCASSGVWRHMTSLAGQGDQPAAVVSLSVSALLCGQVLGALFGVLSAGRLRPGQVFAGAALATLAAYLALALRPPPGLFVLSFGVAGFSSMALGTWLFSFLVQADPSRRAAATSATAQLCGSAIGPVLAAGLVDGGDARLALLSGALLVSITLGIALVLSPRSTIFGLWRRRQAAI
jgi:hypothetical protein